MILRGQFYILLPIAIAGCGQAAYVHSELEPREHVRYPTELEEEFASLMKAASAVKRWPERIAVLLDGIDRFAGTRYERLIETSVKRELLPIAVDIDLQPIRSDPSLSRRQRLRLCQEYFEGTGPEKSVQELYDNALRRARARGASGEPKH